VQNVPFKINGRMRPPRSTSHFALVLRMTKKKPDSDNDWKVIERIKDAFNGADDSSLGPILKNMVDSTDVDLEELETAYLKLNFLARGLKAGLEDLSQSDASDRDGDADSLASRFEN
jgi:hypothetical protein